MFSLLKSAKKEPKLPMEAASLTPTLTVLLQAKRIRALVDLLKPRLQSARYGIVYNDYPNMTPIPFVYNNVMGRNRWREPDNVQPHWAKYSVKIKDAEECEVDQEIA